MSDVYEKDLAINEIHSREVLDSRGYPTIEVEVRTKRGCGMASVPSGASTGSHESLELRDGDKTRYYGKGVLSALKNIDRIIAPQIIGRDVTQQREIDEIMIDLDGTENKSRLGANAILGVSLATAKAAANTLGIPLYKHLGDREAEILPVPMMNVINGGLHAGNNLSIQEFIILPIGGSSFSEALRMGVEVYHTLKTVLRNRYGSSSNNLGDEGGFAPPMEDTREALNTLVKAIDQAGYLPGQDIHLALDAAAESFFHPKRSGYIIDNQFYTAEGMIDLYKDLVEEFPLASIEDPLQEEDFQGFAALTEEIGDKTQIVGDDLFVTNLKRLKRGIKLGSANALLLKVNQVGTLTEAFETASLAKLNDYRVIVSHRSGETTDTYIADIAVALNAGQIKTGAPARGERTAKYNRLLRIESQLGETASYIGSCIFP